MPLPFAFAFAFAFAVAFEDDDPAEDTVGSVILAGVSVAAAAAALRSTAVALPDVDIQPFGFRSLVPRAKLAEFKRNRRKNLCVGSEAAVSSFKFAQWDALSATKK